MLIGVRQLEAGERQRLERSAIHRLAAADVARLPAQLKRVPADRISLHVDLDVLDPSYGRANEYAVGPGLTRDELLDVVSVITRERELVALTLSAYDTLDAPFRCWAGASRAIGSALQQQGRCHPNPQKHPPLMPRSYGGAFSDERSCGAQS